MYYLVRINNLAEEKQIYQKYNIFGKSFSFIYVIILDLARLVYFIFL
jgi:hypothetical protein